ncbi:MAG TPA: hypothetical protein VLV29_05580 [Steroidobacteraceae bacterium]|nr:hypothetical protein [Steroidobacteraceae bacterium]
MSALSEWLQLMLAEIARKQDDSERARAEEARRAAEQHATPGGAPLGSATGVEKFSTSIQDNLTTR